MLLLAIFLSECKPQSGCEIGCDLNRLHPLSRVVRECRLHGVILEFKDKESIFCTM